MYEWSLVTQCCAVAEISYVNGVMRKERIIITRMLQLQATVKRFLFDLQRPSRSTYVDKLMVSKISFLEQTGESNCTKHG